MARKPSPAGRANAWMPMYWGDYLRDTGHLDAQEHGAYLMLIAHYWCNGRPPPDDDRVLCKIARVTPTVWKRIRPTLSNFFEINHGTWGHLRVERELTAALDRKESAVIRAKAGAAARWGDDASSMLGASDKHANHSHNHKYESSSSKISTDPPRDVALGGGSTPRGKFSERMQTQLLAMAEAHRRKPAGDA